ncbi:hypothetical protein SAMN04490355_10011 [Pelosinus propionicus DSM 13327]|uniref:Uncharacterized protein n=1 Tax=Pelosinus propionicus DSM 13327 TaxID=1123291 RepID=A0A1I4GKQ1_9FIRM|nr:hypothetical protein SAMN04490355_10011 [Pelosinus propionicus DSM 13327]
MCKVFHSSLILHQEAGSSEPASCIFNTYKGLSQFLIETAPFILSFDYVILYHKLT